ncbi:MAG: NUDIX domain-containing protein [Bacilli bacterium]|jgi:8-oxo-dGTP pyrophosphatase MutT (NUDIX family)|nr:NUDIX domain-containing protein [Bacilli bacterium]
MEKSVFNNGFLEFLETEEEHTINNQKKLIKRKMVRRPPGVRALILNKNDNQKILLSKEFRYELDKWDYRLPGGKVFDTLGLYKEAIARNDVQKYVDESVAKEVLEEVGLIVKSQKLLKISHDGAGVIWDLFYYEIKDYEESLDGAHLEENEFVEGYVWKSFDEIIKMCIEQKINEERTVGVLLSYILEHKNN